MLSRLLALTGLVASLALPCFQTVTYMKGSYQKTRRSDAPLFRFEENGKAGYVDAQGAVVIRPTFDTVPGYSKYPHPEEDFVEGLSPALEGGKWGFIDPAGKWAVNPSYLTVDPFSEGLAAVTVKGTSASVFIDRSGKVAISLPGRAAAAGRFSEGLVAVRDLGNDGRLGYVDRSGMVVIPYQFAWGGIFQDGLAPVVLDGTCYVESRDDLTRNPTPVGPNDCGANIERSAKKCEEGLIDRTGKVVFRFDRLRGFSEGLAAVQRNGKWGFIDPKGTFQIPARFDDARFFSGGLAAVNVGGKWGYVDRTGRLMIAPQFSKADEFSDGFAVTDKGYIDRSGKLVASPLGATPFVQGLAHITLGKNEFGYIDHSGKIVFRYHAEGTFQPGF